MWAQGLVSVGWAERDARCISLCANAIECWTFAKKSVSASAHSIIIKYNPTFPLSFTTSALPALRSENTLALDICRGALSGRERFKLDQAGVS